MNPLPLGDLRRPSSSDARIAPPPEANPRHDVREVLDGERPLPGKTSSKRLPAAPTAGSGNHAMTEVAGMCPFSLATWNVLAECYARPESFPTASPDVHQGSNRAAAVVVELERLFRELDLDAICLQEVDGDLLHQLRDKQRALGWREIWDKRSTAPDGCAVILGQRWQLRGYERREYTSVRDRIAQRLELIHRDTRLVLYNTHLQWAADHGRSLATQCVELASWTRRETCPTVIAGDLNTPPDSHAMASLLSTGLVNLHPDPSLHTAYIDPTGPMRLDYILFGGMTGLALATGHSLNSTALPSPACPSDHIPLAARIQP